MTVTLVVVVLLIGFSGVCSGLNIALMSLDVADLRRKVRLGKASARRVLPLRQNVHLSLAAILLANVAVVSATSLVLESAFNGLIAGVASTLLIVVFGEVLPQAFFARYALAFCAALSPLLRLMIILTYPVSKPLQLLLDKLFGPERTELHSRRELGVIIAEHAGAEASELDDDEIEIMRGALYLSEKRARDIMTQLRHVYWLLPSDTIDSDKIAEIKTQGWSRIPVFNKQVTICYGVLLMKDLVNRDFAREPVQVDDLPLYPTQTVGSMTALDTLFRKFINGGAHLIPVERDDQIVGIVTIEDLLEEIVGHEIEDETDRSKRRRLRRKK
ncbi:MAG TPA: CNNM domain-containing protein [Nevskiaceae bacterium]|nr:CNNM domain-containing protein [Nevskiaceae bacterium]